MRQPAESLHPLEAHFREAVSGLSLPGQAQRDRVAGRDDLPVRDGSGLSIGRCLELFDAQVASRLCDLAAQWMHGEGRGYYTIASSGHEGNAALAAALKVDDPALLHYRSGAFYITRAAQRPGQNPLRHILFGVASAAAEPIAGGRHKVFGHPDLAVIPMTSTIGSHAPRAVGVALAIERARKLRLLTPWPADAVCVCSVGDASMNHSTVTGALNAALHTAHQGVGMPLLLVCEDNGYGISVPTPSDWVRTAVGDRPGLAYFAADGSDLAGTFDVAESAVAYARRRRRPALLHLKTVRFFGHAGSDAETAYRSPRAIAADFSRDPLLGTAALLVESGRLTPAEILDRYDRARGYVWKVARDAITRPTIRDRAAVIAPLAPRTPPAVKIAAREAASPEQRVRAFADRLPENEGPLTLAQTINRCLADTLAADPRTVVFGQDVAAKGGVYGVTRGLKRTFGPARVFDTLLDEQSILGLGLGMGLAGLLPIPEIQYLAYLHNAEDQLRGEAATMQFFSSGAYRNPMVVRVAGLAYQKGFGGHFHNDNSLAVLRDVPGLVVAVPAHPRDAAPLLRTCLAAARIDGTVSVVVEPIALYHARDLHGPEDGGWLWPYAAPEKWSEEHIEIGRARTYGSGSDITIVTFGNGLPMSLRLASRLHTEGVSVRVVDLLWLAPLPITDLLREAGATRNVLIVDETRRSGGVSEAVVAALVDAGYTGRLARVCSADSYIPLGPAAAHVLLGEPEIEAAARHLLGSRS
ncbi:MAG: thiamine pyrophosphate-dependent enzyme [Actinomycetota bacterium]|nr:thiamine pyrophosphate-dependent enzyme [Actinomycetota bacterium]